METAQKGPDLQRVERLILEMARVFNWISLYQAGHPSLAGRVEELHRDLLSQISGEPSGHLLFGIAKDKILYRDAFRSSSACSGFTRKRGTNGWRNSWSGRG